MIAISNPSTAMLSRNDSSRANSKAATRMPLGVKKSPVRVLSRLSSVLICSEASLILIRISSRMIDSGV
jgi:hypothetical protein